uniref:Uncharacterized protein n=1 Tax=Caenorhabditis japonica TaxID=281687 RepID=A0A8R1IHB4_CAEJA
MASTTINFKLYLAPGAIEKFSLESQVRSFTSLIDSLKLKLGELGLNFNVVFWKNKKGNLISLSQNAQKMILLSRGQESISLYAIPNSSAENSSDSSSGESGDELIVIDSAPESGRARRHRGRRDRSRSRGFDRSRSRSHSRGRTDRCGPWARWGKPHGKRLGHLENRLLFLEAQRARRGPPCFGRRARSASPIRRGSFECPKGFGGPHGFGRGLHGHGHHHMGTYGRFGGHHHGFPGWDPRGSFGKFVGHKGHHHGFPGWDPRRSFGGFGGFGR